MVLGFKLFRCFQKASGSSLTKAKITKVELFDELLNLFLEIDYLMLFMVGGRAGGGDGGNKPMLIKYRLSKV